MIWSKGATASGSSGSPLIDVESRKVVGVLTGGFASCADQTAPDYYGRLSAVQPSHPTPYLHSCISAFPSFGSEFCQIWCIIASHNDVFTML